MAIKLKAQQDINLRKLISVVIIKFIIVFIFVSCREQGKFEYDIFKSEYIDAVNCLRENQRSLFLSDFQGESISLYPKDYYRINGCESSLKSITKSKTEFINIVKDGTIMFYLSSEVGQKQKQRILVFAKSIEDVNRNKPGDSELIKVVDDQFGCYELERILSLAN